jgi:hypothetical protein
VAAWVTGTFVKKITKLLKSGAKTFNIMTFSIMVELPVTAAR